jgi:hypothetical protein
MGNVTISTEETTIYWPSDWLVDGAGTTFTDMGCPKMTLDEADMFSILSIVFDIDDATWRVYTGDLAEGEVIILMESKNYKDIATYFTDFMIKTKQWWDDQQAEAAAYEKRNNL